MVSDLCQSPSLSDQENKQTSQMVIDHNSSATGVELN